MLVQCRNLKLDRPLGQPLLNNPKRLNPKGIEFDWGGTDSGNESVYCK